MNRSVIRLFAGLSLLFSVCFNSFFLAEAKGGQTSERPLLRSSKMREVRERESRNFTGRKERGGLRARGIVVRFHRWPGVKKRKKVAGILKSKGLKRTKSIRGFKAQLFGWREGGLKPSRQAERACAQLRGLSYVRRCSPDHLLSVNYSGKNSRFFTVRGTISKQSQTEAGFVFECEDCKNRGLESIAEPLKEAVSVQACGLIPKKRKLMEGTLSDYWAQELIGSDLLREELEKTAPPNIENWIAVFDSKGNNHNIHVRNLISDEGAHAILPELTDRKIPFIDTKDSKIVQSDSDYRKGKGYKSALSLYETSYPGDYLFGFKKRAPHYINNSANWLGSKDIYEVFQKLSSAKISPPVVVVSSGNGFPGRLDDIQEQASKDFDVILVGSFSPKGFVSEFSQSGREVSVLAPSDYWITSADKKGEYKKFGGTSGAVPLVTGSLAGFEWLSGYHPTAKEAKVLLEKTALPTLHSHEKPRINGAGLLNAYKLGEVGKRLKKKCRGKGVSCFKKEILKDENYQFSEDRSLKDELSRAFPSCGFGKGGVRRDGFRRGNSEVLPQISSCEEKREMFKSLRRAVLLNPSPKLLRSLSCIYKEAGFGQNAKALESLAWALSSEEELRAKLKTRVAIERGKEGMSDEILRLMLGMGGFGEELTESEWMRGLKMAGGMDARALPLLERGFESGNLQLQERALISASQIGEKALPLLEKGFESGNLQLQERALFSAGEIGEKVLPLLEKGFESGNLQLQERALYSAGEIGEKGLPLLEKGFESGNLQLQERALFSAGEMGEKALPLLEKGFESGNLALQKMALSLAGLIGEKALPLLEKGFESGNLQLQEEALSSAGLIGEKALPLLEKGFESGNLQLQKRALFSARRAGEKVLPLLERGFESGNLQLQEVALSSAGLIGEKALSLLKKMLKSQNLNKNIKSKIQFIINRHE